MKGRLRLLSILLGGVACLTALVFLAYKSPPYTFHPLCTYRSLSKITVKISVAGEVHRSSVVHQATRSRRWIAIMNSGGCKSSHGTALAFKLNDGNAVLMPSAMCHKAEQELLRTGDVDILEHCKGRREPGRTAYVIESADHPQRWRPVAALDNFRVIEMTAVSTWKSPSDDLDILVPNILKSRFETQGSWSKGPEKILSYGRRYNPSKAFAFEVKKQSF